MSSVRFGNGTTTFEEFRQQSRSGTIQTKMGGLNVRPGAVIKVSIKQDSFSDGPDSTAYYRVDAIIDGKLYGQPIVDIALAVNSSPFSKNNSFQVVA